MNILLSLKIPPGHCGIVVLYFCTVRSCGLPPAPKLGQRVNCIAGSRRAERGAGGATELCLMQGPDAAAQ